MLGPMGEPGLLEPTGEGSPGRTGEMDTFPMRHRAWRLPDDQHPGRSWCGCDWARRGQVAVLLAGATCGHLGHEPAKTVNVGQGLHGPGGSAGQTTRLSSHPFPPASIHMIPSS